MNKSIEEINEKIRTGTVRVVTAEEMPNIVKDVGTKEAVKEVDVVTTGTFGVMCSSGAFLNFGHSDPPIKMRKVFLNGVEAYTGIAAVDAYIGAAQTSKSRGMEYGGGYVIEDMISRREIEVKAESYGTDCYPLRNLETSITIDDLNQAVMLNPRNGYQRHDAATNSKKDAIYTYMGPLFPHFGNVSYSGSGLLSPLSNDPTYKTTGMGTRIFLGGAKGYIIGEGTQHDPDNGHGTLMVKGNLKEMDPDFIRGATIYRYGVSIYIGLGVPIPILNEDIAKSTSIEDKEIVTNLVDYGVQRREKPVLRKVTYEELKSGCIEFNGKEIKTFPMSSYHKAREVAEKLKEWIEKGDFELSMPVERLPVKGRMKNMRQTKIKPPVKHLMAKEVISANQEISIEEAAKVLIENEIDHLPIVLTDNKVVGIITSWDISKSVARGKFKRVSEIMTKKVVSVEPEDLADVAARKLEKYNISAMPVINKDGEIVGVISSGDLSKLIGKW
ncbi:MAG: Inosine-5'-monophosphate dehydrogenase [Candidatus Methanolliviera sp. GoM_asphalt]|nr:MAG: Inosine-5'-monophosphate dehydrogenase [Candidatus Methanolliviera sp. GoM_asphalt]